MQSYNDHDEPVAAASYAVSVPAALTYRAANLNLQRRRGACQVEQSEDSFEESLQRLIADEVFYSISSRLLIN